VVGRFAIVSVACRECPELAILRRSVTAKLAIYPQRRLGVRRERVPLRVSWPLTVVLTTAVLSARNHDLLGLSARVKLTHGTGCPKTGQTVLIYGAAGGVGSLAVQLAHELGARVIGTGRAGDREAVLGLGADAFVDLQADRLGDAGEVDVVFDVIGGEVLERSALLVRAGGTLVTIVARRRCGPPTAGRSSSSSSRTGSGWRTSPSGCGPDG
jgi:NADPH:quinone reductase-like Zn-dependent oxidoreductase